MYTDYFKLLSRTSAIKTLNLKFLTERKAKKKFVTFNEGKNDWQARNRIYVFLRIMHCHNAIGYEDKFEEENLDSEIVAETERKKSL